MSGLSPAEDQRRREMYAAGSHDSAIAKAVGVKPPAIAQWRLIRGLPGICRPGHPPRNPNAARLLRASAGSRRMQLYLSGLNDGQIARAEGLNYGTIKSWRRSRGLPANRPHAARHIEPAEEEMRGKLYSAGGWDAIMGRVIGLNPANILRWRYRRKLIRNTRPKLEATSTVSLDAQHGEGGVTLLDFIADESQSAWLEEMGATVW